MPSNDGTNLQIDAQADVSGGITGISARNTGVGMTSITTTGVVTGIIGYGIFGLNFSSATDLLIDAQADVSSGRVGISARNFGTGTTTITTNAAITGGSGYGINAETGSGGNSIIDLNTGP
ncbi:MAG: hypothetical protein L3J24_14125 [Xanthomonadales bacterium]|nr:hypothetical protein [Xanthomonadales bacterium]